MTAASLGAVAVVCGDRSLTYRELDELAARLGMHRGAARAVGAANGRNPIGIVIPCHRVVGTNGSLSGYAGGVERKQLLLRLEQDALF